MHLMGFKSEIPAYKGPNTEQASDSANIGTDICLCCNRISFLTLNISSTRPR